MAATRPDLRGHHVLVTGGTGFLGGYIVDAFLEQHPEAKVTVADLVQSRHWKDVEFVTCDVTKASHVLDVLRTVSPTIIVHSAGIVPSVNERRNQLIKNMVFDVNVQGTDNVLVAAKKLDIKHFVLTSSVTAITDDPGRDYPNYSEDTRSQAKLIYGQSKNKAEQLVLAANNPPQIQTTSLRPCTIIGPGDVNLVPTLFACIRKLETPFIIGPAYNLYDFVYVTNVADAHVLAIENLVTSFPNSNIAGEAFSITNQEPVPFRDFCKAIWAHLGHVPPLEVRIPASVGLLVGLAAEWVSWATGVQATISRGSVKDYVQTAYADPMKARDVLGYVPRIRLADGLKIACDDFRERLEDEQANQQLQW